MNPYQRLVEEFHYATGSTVGDRPQMRDAWLRANLIMEEAAETVSAMGYHVKVEFGNWDFGDDGPMEDDHIKWLDYPGNKNLPQAIDGLVDLLYVTFGAAVAWGIDLDPFFAEVQRANMSKASGPKRADGKQLKPEGWQPPDIEGVLALHTK